MPGWRNGIRKGLKILGPQGLVGSSPTPGIKIGEPPVTVVFQFLNQMGLENRNERRRVRWGRAKIQ